MAKLTILGRQQQGSSSMNPYVIDGDLPTLRDWYAQIQTFPDAMNWAGHTQHDVGGFGINDYEVTLWRDDEMTNAELTKIINE